MAGQSVGNRLENLKLEIASAAEASGRAPLSVQLLAVSKVQDIDKIREAYHWGQRDFAENYVQEVLSKQNQIEGLDIRWHFIGRIQSNKIKQLAGQFFAIHSVERAEIAQELNRHCKDRQIKQNIFLQFNVAHESSKAGASEDQLEKMSHSLKQCQNLRTLGLMVMPPLNATVTESRQYFALTRKMLERLRAKFYSENMPLNELSMGTSHDFKEAIAEGATWVRIGSELFGPRPKRAAREESP